MVTAELAVAITAILAVLVALIAVVLTVGAQMSCVDAAREGARAAARGESDGVVRAVVAKSAPPGASTTLEISGESVTVTVRATVRPFGGVVGSWTVDASATARLEPAGSGVPP